MAFEKPDRYVTAAARLALVRRFNLPDDAFSQDWEWEAADPSRFGEFLGAYVSDPLDEDERFALMEILIQSIEDMDLPQIETSWQWRSVADLLRTHAKLHVSSVRYWSCLECHNLEDGFRVTGPMRAVWAVICGAIPNSLGLGPDSCE